MGSIFSTYSQGENRVTSSIIQVLRNLPFNVVEQFLVMFADSETQSFFRFLNQVKGKGSTSDAEISANFRLLFETKIERGKVNEKQLQQHLQLANKRKAILVYLTPDNSRPSELNDEKIIWKSFQNVFDLIDELLKEPTLILSERDQFLLKNLQELFVESGLLPKIDEVVVVAASTAWPVYLKHGLYVCQAGRSFRDVEWIGFYAKGAIQNRVAKIRKRCDEFEFTDDRINEVKPELAAKLKQWLEENVWAKGLRLQVFELSPPDSKETRQLKTSIHNDLKNRGGRSYAYTQGQRYTSLRDLERAVSTSDL